MHRLILIFLDLLASFDISDFPHIAADVDATWKKAMMNKFIYFILDTNRVDCVYNMPSAKKALTCSPAASHLAVKIREDSSALQTGRKSRPFVCRETL